MAQQILDTVNDDGSVTRQTTTILPNGDIDVLTHVFTSDEYQALATNLQVQITDLQTTLAPVQANVATVQANVAKLVQPQPLPPQPSPVQKL